MPKHVALLLFLLLAFVSGVARQYFAPGQLFASIDVPFLLVGLGLVFYWYRTDANQRGYRRSAVLNIMVVALTLLALPYYLFRSRGFLRGLVATAIFFAVAVTYSALQIGGEWAAYYGLQS